VPRIVDLRAFPFDIPLTEPFGIATGAQVEARNVLVELELDDGTVGLGEAAPFPAVSGETQEKALAALPEARDALVGTRADRFRLACGAAREPLATTPAALSAVEGALFDALARRARLPLLSFFGGAESQLFTDITIPTGDVAHAVRSALAARASGFRTLKIKVGKDDLETDAARIRGVHAATPEMELVLDANAVLRASDALALLRALGPSRSRVVLFEQPTPAEDLDGLAEVQREGGVRVAADESARSVADVAALARRGDVAVINVKTAKAGVLGAWEMSTVARAHGLGLMVGGMVESELSMTTSACLAAGLGGFDFVDLDTPLFMGPRALAGGFAQAGPRLDLGAIAVGHGVCVDAGSGAPVPTGWTPPNASR